MKMWRGVSFVCFFLFVCVECCGVLYSIFSLCKIFFFSAILYMYSIHNNMYLVYHPNHIGYDSVA